MSKITTAEVRAYLTPFQGQELSLEEIRSICHIERYGNDGAKTESYDYIRVILDQLADAKFVRWLKRGIYRVVEPVEPVRVFLPNREERPLFELFFPRDFDTGMEMDFAQHIVVREGDLITLGGVKSSCKTQLCLSIAGENINRYPVIMGNEYTFELSLEEQLKQGKKYEVYERFYSRMKAMSDWFYWTDEEGEDKFELLPVWDDYAEHIKRDRMNIIDYVDLEADKLYDVGKVLKAIKRNVGRGIAIVALQKREGAGDPRGGQFVRDASDLEILLDGFGDDPKDVLLTVRGCKESRKSIVGKTYAFGSSGGVKIINFREVKKCSDCRGQGFKAGKPCEMCNARKFIDA